MRSWSGPTSGAIVRWSSEAPSGGFMPGRILRPGWLRRLARSGIPCMLAFTATLGPGNGLLNDQSRE